MNTVRKIINLIISVAVVISMYMIYKYDNFDSLFTESVPTNDGSAINKNPNELNNLILDSVNKIASQSVVTPGTVQKISDYKIDNTSISISGVISITNDERQKVHAQQLKESIQLDNSAQQKAEDIISKQYFAHVSPSGLGVSDLVKFENYEFLKVGENLALGNFKSDKDVMEAWMASPGHKANILDSSYEEIGIGIKKGIYQGNEVFVIVQHFGRPRSSCPTISTEIKNSFDLIQQKIFTEESQLKELKETIEGGRMVGKDMNDYASTFNQIYNSYKKDYLIIEDLRKQYNLEVEKFNNCLNKVQ